MPKKFFGARADLTLRFPFADGIAAVNAVPASFVLPDRRQVIVNIGSRTFSTQAPPADVLLDIQAINTTAGRIIRVRAFGTAYTAGGAKKSVDALVEAVVQP
jgi:hypothetical protein